MEYAKIPLEKQFSQVSKGMCVHPEYAPLTIRAWASMPIAAYLSLGSGGRREAFRRLLGMLPHAEVMIHDPLATGISGSALSVEESSRRLMNIRQTTAEILAGHTGHTIEEVYEKTRQDSYFNAKEAVEWGLADRIITEI